MSGSSEPSLATLYNLLLTIAEFKLLNVVSSGTRT